MQQGRLIVPTGVVRANNGSDSSWLRETGGGAKSALDPGVLRGAKIISLAGASGTAIRRRNQ